MIIIAGILILVAAAVVITWLCVRKRDDQVTVFVAQPGFGEIKPGQGGVLTTNANLWATLDK